MGDRNELFEENAMGAKEVKFSVEAREKMLRGIGLCLAVSLTGWLAILRGRSSILIA